MRSNGWRGVALAAGILACGVACELGNDIDCLDDPFNNSDECVHDATVIVRGLDEHLGRTLLVKVESLGSGRDERTSVVVTTSVVTVVFDDYRREGGGPYEARAAVDLNGNGSCDDSPTDAVWRGTFDDDDDTWVLYTDTSPQTTCD
jgi:hypothetical protein